MEKWTKEALNNKIWQAADILRGSIDSADYKNYILGLMFLKRLSDVFEEEARKIEQETGDKELAWNDPDEHQFFVRSGSLGEHQKGHSPDRRQPEQGL
jgi:type I restriction enzyme M protein